jgi:hypothetical protein
MITTKSRPSGAEITLTLPLHVITALNFVKNRVTLHLQYTEIQTTWNFISITHHNPTVIQAQFNLSINILPKLPGKPEILFHESLSRFSDWRLPHPSTVKLEQCPRFASTISDWYSKAHHVTVTTIMQRTRDARTPHDPAVPSRKE